MQLTLFKIDNTVPLQGTPQVMTISPQDIIKFTPSRISYHPKIGCLSSVNFVKYLFI